MSGSSNKINKNKLNEDNTRTLFVTIPPDGGWGWVIMIASFCCNTIVDGIVFNSGFIQADVENDFKLTKAQVSYIFNFFCQRFCTHFYHSQKTSILRFIFEVNISKRGEK